MKFKTQPMTNPTAEQFCQEMATLLMEDPIKGHQYWFDYTIEHNVVFWEAAALKERIQDLMNEKKEK